VNLYDPQSQRDPQWAGEELGTVAGATIGQYGCFIAVAAMIASHYTGALVTPHDVNQAMKARGLYVQGDLFPDAALDVLYPQIALEGEWNFAGIPADLSKLAMDDTEERVVVIDFDHNPADGIQTHALRAFSWDGRRLVVDDPWTGTRDDFTLHYGANLPLTIQKIVGYKVAGFVPPWKRPPPVVDPCADVKLELAATTAARDQAAAKVAAFVAWIQGAPK
jgi:hypothetical protein